MSYFQTAPLTSDELKDAIITAKRQDDAVLALFRRLRSSLLAPSDVHLMLRKYGRHVLLTSVRRSLSSLTEDELLIKTDTLRPGPHGKPEHCWRLRDHEAHCNLRHPATLGTDEDCCDCAMASSNT